MLTVVTDSSMREELALTLDELCCVTRRRCTVDVAFTLRVPSPFESWICRNSKNPAR